MSFLEAVLAGYAVLITAHFWAMWWIGRESNRIATEILDAWIEVVLLERLTGIVATESGREQGGK